MAVIKRDGFNSYDGLNSNCIAIERNRMDSYLKYIKEHNIRWISINNLYYFGKNIDFLVDFPYVEKITITSSSILDYYGLKNLKPLKCLSLEDPKGKIDLSNNISLEELSAEMNNNIIGIDKLENLKILRLWKYKPKTKDLTELGKLKAIEELKITQSPRVSLNGCGELHKLKKLELSYLSKLEYIDEIEKNKNNLKNLRFTSCKKIRNHDYVKSLCNLELLAFDDCGEIPTISFIEKLNNLKSFIFMKTNIIDGVLSPCKELEYVAFLDKKHYSHKNKDFNKK